MSGNINCILLEPDEPFDIGILDLEDKNVSLLYELIEDLKERWIGFWKSVREVEK